MITLQTLPVLIMWAVVAIRLLGLRFGWKPGILPASALVALALSLNIDQVYLFVDGLLGGWNLLNLIVHLLMGAGMTELSRLLLRATGRRGRRNQHVYVLLGIGVVLTVVQVTLLAMSHTEGSATNFTDTFGHIPTVAAYQASYFGWIGIVLGYTGVECMRRDKDGESRSFGIGFNIVSLGCLSGVAAVAMKMLLIAVAAADLDAGFPLYLTYRILVAAGIVCFAVGFILPSYDRIRSTYAARRQRRMHLDALRPIVARLAETTEGRSSFDAGDLHLSARTSGRQLYRWLIFVGDIRVLDPDLLTAEETDIVDEIGMEIERNDRAARYASAGV